MTPEGRSPRTVRIEAAGAPYAALIAGLSAFGSAEPWPERAVARILDLPGCWGFLALEPEGRAIGFVVGRVAADEAEIMNLVVIAHARRKGVGRSLLAAAIEKAREHGASAIFLEVAADNRAGHALYESAGFEEVGVRPDYYRKRSGDYVDALIMKRATVNPAVD